MGRYDALTQLEDTPEKLTPAPHMPLTKSLRKKTDLLANQQTSKTVKTPLPQRSYSDRGQDIRQPSSPAQGPEQTLDTSLLTTKEKTKYGTYLTDESIEKIGIRAIQLKRDSHQIVQEAINQYFERLGK